MSTASEKKELCIDCRAEPIEKEDGYRCSECRILSDAIFAFWEVVAKNHPEIKHGDGDDHDLRVAARAEIRDWLSNNQTIGSPEWMATNMHNDCVSTDDELVAFFIEEGVSEDTAKKAIAHREECRSSRTYRLMI